MYFLEMKGLSIFFMSCSAETSVYNCFVKSESNLISLFMITIFYIYMKENSRTRLIFVFRAPGDNICVDFF